jgi:hypothetical protein
VSEGELFFAQKNGHFGKKKSRKKKMRTSDDLKQILAQELDAPDAMSFVQEIWQSLSAEEEVLVVNLYPKAQHWLHVSMIRILRKHFYNIPFEVKADRIYVKNCEVRLKKLQTDVYYCVLNTNFKTEIHPFETWRNRNIIQRNNLNETMLPRDLQLLILTFVC